MRQLRFDLGDGAEVRTFSLEDAETIYELVDANRERLARWFPWVDDSTSPETQRTWLSGLMQDDVSCDGNGIWVEGVLAGGVGMGIHVVENSGEIGYWLDVRYEGRGLVTRGCRAFLNYGFGELALHRVQIRAAVENTRSRAVAERLGLREEGVLRGAGRVGGGKYVDLVMYGILANEWTSGG
jgi:ribosomal-protein-serine acetyltransferase